MGRLQKPDCGDAPVRPAESLPLFAAGAATDGANEKPNRVPSSGSAPSATSSSPSGEASPTALDVQVPSGGEVVSSVPQRASATAPCHGASVAGGVSPAPTAHHPLGMSRWPAALACPRFEGAEAGGDAAYGTNVHATLAWWLSELRERGRLPEVEAESLSFHEAGAWKAAQTIEAELRVCGASPRALRVEERVSLYYPGTHEHVFGTADALFVHDGAVHVFDFKTFYNPGRDYMPQLQGYGLAAARASKEEIDTVVCSVLYGDAPAKAERQVFDKSECERVAERALDTLSMPREELAKAGAEPTQCAWCELCAHFASCPACVAVASEITKATTGTEDAGLCPAAPGGDVVPSTPGAPAACPDWAALPATRKAQLMVIAEFASKWADAVRSKAKADMLAGEAIADPANGIAYALRETRGRLKLDCDALWAVCKARGVSAAAFRACLKPDATEAKKALRAAGLKATAADDVLESCGTRGASSQTLVRA